jgi:ketosteroid isomerase-like protein
MSKRIVALLLLLISPVLAAQETDQAIHDELRDVLNGIQEAVNSEKYGDLSQYFHENLTITTINQEVISTRAEIEPYFDKWFGPGGYLQTLKMSLEADDLTEFYADKTFGIVRGSGEEDYVLSDSRSFPMKTRWTATVIKDTDGKWRILTLHIGTDFLDNPILAVAEDSAKFIGAAGGAVGLVFGLLIMFMLGRRKRTL